MPLSIIQKSPDQGKNTQRVKDKTRGGLTSFCPVAQEMMKRPRLALPLMLLGLAFILAGALVFVEPLILMGLSAATSVLVGVSLLVFSNAIRTGIREREKHRLSLLS